MEPRRDVGEKAKEKPKVKERKEKEEAKVRATAGTNLRRTRRSWRLDNKGDIARMSTRASSVATGIRCQSVRGSGKETWRVRRR